MKKVTELFTFLFTARTEPFFNYIDGFIVNKNKPVKI